MFDVTKLKFRFASAKKKSVMSAIKNHGKIKENMPPNYHQIASTRLPAPPKNCPKNTRLTQWSTTQPVSQHPNRLPTSQHVAKVTENGSNGLGAPGIPQFNLRILAAALRVLLGSSYGGYWKIQQQQQQQQQQEKKGSFQKGKKSPNQTLWVPLGSRWGPFLARRNTWQLLEAVPTFQEISIKVSHTPPKFNSSPLKNGWLEDDPFLLGK